MGKTLLSKLTEFIHEEKLPINTINLIGHSLGGRLVVHCLKSITDNTSPQLTINDVLLMAAAVEAQPCEARSMRDLIKGRLFNAYSTDDRILWLPVDEKCIGRREVDNFDNVLIDGFGAVGALEKLGVERRLLTAGENKGFLDPFSPQSEAHRAHAQRMLDQIHQQFIDVVRQGRGERLKETPDMFSGLFWTGEQAVQLGLADQLGSLDMVAREVVKAEKLVDYTNKQNFAERFAKRLGAQVGEGALAALRGAPGWR